MKQVSETAEKILRMVQDDISAQCPFLTGACGILLPVEEPSVHGSGTDGSSFFYDPEFMIEEFMKSGRLRLNRRYLHSLFHCMYLHTREERKKDPEIWALCCDLVVEYTIECLDRPFLTGERNREKDKIFRRFWKDKKAKTAADLYRQIREEKVEKTELLSWKSLFYMDSHDPWGKGQEMNLEGIRKAWEKTSAFASGNGGMSGKRPGSEKGNVQEWYEIQQKRRRDYRRFLRRFAVQREEVRIDMDSFDYIPYCMGLERYGNMPLIEPLEYTEAFKLEEMVIAIDTSSSCSRPVVQRFLEETYAMLSDRENFFKKMNVHIIQCDCYIQDDITITCEEDWKKYMKEIKIQGRGGTDFRPVFRYVDRLIQEKKIKNLKGLIYFTDGDGIYPVEKPSYETAFVFIKDPPENVKIPGWAIRLFLDERKTE